MTTTDAPAPAAVRRPRTRVRETLLLAIFAGGVVGALLRAGVERAVPASGHGWPWATFAVNVAGCVVLAYAVTLLQERLPPSTFRRPFLGTGLCGALTTFSTLQVESITLARNGHAGLGAAYLVVSVVTGLVAVHVVTALARRPGAR